MIILNNMYTGRYISQQGKLGHEAINLIRADDGKFYLWLNSMGICARKDVEGCDMIMLRTIDSSLYKVLAKAENCHLLPGADIPRKKYNAGTEDKELRAAAQARLQVTYNGRAPMGDIYHEQDMFATFSTEKVYETQGDIYLTNDVAKADPAQHIYYANFRMSEAMRTYVTKSHGGYVNLETFLGEDIWQEPVTMENRFQTELQETTFNFFKLIRKDKDELSFSNALAYFIEKAGIDTFLRQGLCLEASFLADSYIMLREKNNIDISFFGENHVVIIENKIDAYITADKKTKISNQIKKAADLYFDECSTAEKEEYKNLLTAFAQRYTGNASQLSKYYLYAVAYLLSKGVDIGAVEDHIRCFLLVPEYSGKQFKQDDRGCFASDFCLSEKYKLITYKDIFQFFSRYPVDDPYTRDFLSALVPLKKEFNNELEEEMKLRFLQAIGIA